MTDLAIQNSTFRLLRELNTLTYAANLCATNYSYYQSSSRSGELALLDCDLLWYAVQSRDDPNPGKSTSDACETDLQSELPNWSGANTLRYVIKNLEQYAIPPGACAELLRRKEGLRGQLSKIAKGMLEKFDRARMTPDPVRAVLREQPVDEFIRVLADEVTSVDSMYEDMRLTESAIERSINIGELLGPAPEQSAASYHATFNHLQARRDPRQWDKNNFSDAINVAVMVWLFHSPNLKFRGGRGNSFVPILVTRTGDVADLQRMLPLPKPDDVMLVQRLNSFLVSQAFRQIHGGDARAVINDAQTLAQECGRLQADAQRLIGRIQRSGVARGPELNLLRRSLARFSMHWEEVLDPVKRYPDLDRVALCNTLLAKKLRPLLKEFDSSPKNGDLCRRVLDLAHEAIHENHDFLEGLIFDQDTTPELQPQVLLTQVEADQATTLLRDQRPGAPLSKSNQLNRHECRLAAFVEALPDLGAAFVADWSEEDPDRLQLTWVHRCATATAIKELHFAIRRLGRLLGPPRECRFFGGGDPHTLQLDEDVERSEVEMLLHSNAGSYVEMVASEMAMFADLEPLGGEENQVGVVGPLSVWTPEFVQGVVELGYRMGLQLPRAATAAAISAVVESIRRVAKDSQTQKVSHARKGSH